jgi:hypothetical protein
VCLRNRATRVNQTPREAAAEQLLACVWRSRGNREPRAGHHEHTTNARSPFYTGFGSTDSEIWSREQAPARAPSPSARSHIPSPTAPKVHSRAHPAPSRPGCYGSPRLGAAQPCARGASSSRARAHHTQPHSPFAQAKGSSRRRARRHADPRAEPEPLAPHPRRPRTEVTGLSPRAPSYTRHIRPGTPTMRLGESWGHIHRPRLPPHPNPPKHTTTAPRTCRPPHTRTTTPPRSTGRQKNAFSRLPPRSPFSPW